MASLTKSDSFTLPARAVAAFPVGGAGTATVNGATSTLGLQPVRLGPFSTDKIVQVVVGSGTIVYQVEPGQADVVEVTPDGQIVGPGGTILKVSPSGGIPLSADITLTADDDGKQYACTVSLTVTLPAGLSPRPQVAFVPPPTGNLTIARSGAAQINGGSASVTRTRTANPAGIVIQPYAESDGYGVSGS